jgi:hypothetical protein
VRQDPQPAIRPRPGSKRCAKPARRPPPSQKKRTNPSGWPTYGAGASTKQAPKALRGASLQTVPCLEGAARPFIADIGMPGRCCGADLCGHWYAGKALRGRSLRTLVCREGAAGPIFAGIGMPGRLCGADLCGHWYAGKALRGRSRSTEVAQEDPSWPILAARSGPAAPSGASRGRWVGLSPAVRPERTSWLDRAGAVCAAIGLAAGQERANHREHGVAAV